MERRVDFLTALRDNTPPDLARLYWLARVTLVASREGIPATGEPEQDGESEAPEGQGGDDPLPVVVGEGTGRDASVHELRHRRSYDPTSADLRAVRRALDEHLPCIRSRRRRPDRRGH